METIACNAGGVIEITSAVLIVAYFVITVVKYVRNSNKHARV
jgi:hypothetical protein